VLAARVIGGSSRIERRAEPLRSRLPTWPTPPGTGIFLMAPHQDAFDPAGISSPGAWHSRDRAGPAPYQTRTPFAELIAACVALRLLPADVPDLSVLA